MNSGHPTVGSRPSSPQHPTIVLPVALVAAAVQAVRAEESIAREIPPSVDAWISALTVLVLALEEFINFSVLRVINRAR